VGLIFVGVEKRSLLVIGGCKQWGLRQPEENIMDYRKCYKTAFSPLFQVFVKIVRTYTTDSGEFIFVCSSCYDPKVTLKDHLFTERELTGFCL